MRALMLILAAFLVAAGAGFYVLQNLAPAAQPVAVAEVEPPREHSVFVPAARLAVGTILKPEHLGRVSIPVAAVTDEMVVADDAGLQTLIGSVARQSLPAGMPIARSAVVQPGDRGFLAAVLPQGKRAISILISEVAGISGLVLPGDRVDIILTYSVEGQLIESGRDIRASETVMTNLRVLALDQRLQTGGAPGEPGAPPAPIARTATLEVTPQQAEMITLATTLGDLSFVLNSVRDGGEPAVAEERVAAARSARAIDAALPARKLTIDSDVTSLLQRALAQRDETAPLPVVERLSRVQVVRGIVASDFELGAATAAGPAIGAATAAGPAIVAAGPAPVIEQ